MGKEMGQIEAVEPAIVMVCSFGVIAASIAYYRNKISRALFLLSVVLFVFMIGMHVVLMLNEVDLAQNDLPGAPEEKSGNSIQVLKGDAADAREAQADEPEADDESE
jgi:hypothetical protein